MTKAHKLDDGRGGGAGGGGAWGVLKCSESDTLRLSVSLTVCGGERGAMRHEPAERPLDKCLSAWRARSGTILGPTVRAPSGSSLSPYPTLTLTQTLALTTALIVILALTLTL